MSYAVKIDDFFYNTISIGDTKDLLIILFTNHHLMKQHSSCVFLRVHWSKDPTLIDGTITNMSAKLKLKCDAVGDVGAEDDSLVSVPASVISEAGFVPGDTVLVRGKKGKDTLAIIVADDSGAKGNLRMSTVARRNLGLALGDTCTVSAPASEVNFATSVKVLPYDDSVKGEWFAAKLRRSKYLPRTPCS